jgi:hypothetical protein
LVRFRPGPVADAAQLISIPFEIVEPAVKNSVFGTFTAVDHGPHEFEDVLHAVAIHADPRVQRPEVKPLDLYPQSLLALVRAA